MLKLTQNEKKQLRMLLKKYKKELEKIGIHVMI